MRSEKKSPQFPGVKSEHGMAEMQDSHQKTMFWHGADRKFEVPPVGPCHNSLTKGAIQ